MDFLRKTFGGLSRSYYIRQFLFGLIPCFLIIFLIGITGYINLGRTSMLTFSIIWGIINLPLYPYSRFVFESIVNYIMGNNIFIMNAWYMMMIKLMNMLLCFYFAIFIAPIGLIYLYFYHSKQEKEFNQQNNE